MKRHAMRLEPPQVDFLRAVSLEAPDMFPATFCIGVWRESLVWPRPGALRPWGDGLWHSSADYYLTESGESALRVALARSTSLSDPAPHEEPTSDGGARSRDALRRGRRTLRTFHGRFLK